ncbi:LytR/AlgR family response regulator transcription factor [Rubrivirga sp. IMCC45206]|uniref:LytR/AlgR family response regulator transcription factor n=1 Tax=Rubrivirga sp. IMCC45206 TaxID=3391614 RepID=UPI00398FF54A
MPDPRPLRAVVVDDERLARRELRTLLAAHPEVEVVAEAVDADAAEAVLAGLAADGAPPDVLFLDVQMPGRTGFDLLDGLDAAPDVVFVTAYDEHALRAFRVSALDYLLKPVDPERLAEAIARVAARAAARPADAPAVGGPLGPVDRVFVKDGDRMHLVRLGDVRRFESVGNYTRLHFDGPAGPETAVVARSLSGLEDRLDPAHFARASRADLVGLAHVVGIDDALNGGLLARLTDGTTVEFSRRRAAALRDRLRL